MASTLAPATAHLTPSPTGYSSSNCSIKDSNFVYAPEDKTSPLTAATNHITNSGTNNHCCVFNPGGDKFNDKAGGTSTASMCNGNDSIGSNITLPGSFLLSYHHHVT
jgi:hypothetical protein